MSIVIVDSKTAQLPDSGRKLRSQQPSVFYQLADRTARNRQYFTPKNSQQFIMAESSGVRPPIFYGRPDEDADAFVKAFERYTKYREITDNDKKLNLFAVLLKDSAADWLDALPDDAKDTFAKLSASFSQRYQSTEALKFKCASDLFTSKQKENESVDEYVTRLRKLARLIDVDDKILQFALINGLKPYIAAHVTQAKPESIEKTIEAARLAELAMSKVAMSDSAVCQQLADLNAEMRRLSIKVDQVTTTTVSRSPTPERRVRFAQPESSAVGRSATTVQDGVRPSDDGSSRPRGPSVQRATYNQQRPREEWQQQHRSEQPTGRCTRCARYHSNKFCPARDPTKSCFFCQKPGHFQAACFAKARSQQ